MGCDSHWYENHFLTPLFLSPVLYLLFYSLKMERKKTWHYVTGNTQVNAFKHYTIVFVHKPLQLISVPILALPGVLQAALTAS